MHDQESERNDFWLDLGPAAEWEGTIAEETARREGDASPDGRLHGFFGAENGTIYEPSAQNCGCGQPDRTPPSHTGQTPDVDADNVPAELPPLPPETWPGL